MKKLSEFTSVSEAREHQEVSSKMVSADMMRVFMLQHGLYGYFKNHTSDFQMATFDNMMSGGEFNFMDGHSSNVEGLMDIMISGEADATVKANLEALKASCKAYANTYTNPYAEVDSTEYDAAIADANSVGATNASVFYDDYDSAQGWHVRVSGKQTLIRIELDEAQAYDTTVKVYCSSREQGDQDFLPLSQSILTPIVIKAGETGANVTVVKNYGRHTQYQLVSNRPDSFKALVTAK